MSSVQKLSMPWKMHHWAMFAQNVNKINHFHTFTNKTSVLSNLLFSRLKRQTEYVSHTHTYPHTEYVSYFCWVLARLASKDWVLAVRFNPIDPQAINGFPPFHKNIYFYFQQWKSCQLWGILNCQLQPWIGGRFLPQTVQTSILNSITDKNHYLHGFTKC